MDKNIIKIYEIVENMIFDFYCNETVNEIINTRTEATEIERHLRKIFIYHISEFLEKVKVEEQKLDEENQPTELGKIMDEVGKNLASNIKLPKF